MTHITQEDLVRYLYDETSEHKSELIKEALETDMNLRDSFDALLLSKRKLEEINFSPRQESVEKILQYAGKQEKHLHSH
ncbi:MAG: hypothetical protein M3Z92_01705 [Bacteroidota bacterium]|nr:hypothetical protein [Bacteroidota bacterium]